MRLAIVPPDTAPLGVSVSRDLAISPDGTQVVYNGPNPDGTGSQLTLRSLDTRVGEPLQGGQNGIGPFFSPDGQWVGFLDGSGRSGGWPAGDESPREVLRRDLHATGLCLRIQHDFRQLTGRAEELVEP